MDSQSNPIVKNGLGKEDEVNKWEGVRCPICMEHPHKAVLLLCTSHDKGCRPFMCNTNDRHSNCFRLFKNSFRKKPRFSSVGSRIRGTSRDRNERGSSSRIPTYGVSNALTVGAAASIISGGRNERGSLSLIPTDEGLNALTDAPVAPRIGDTLGGGNERGSLSMTPKDGALNALTATAAPTTIRDTSGGRNERGSLSMISTDGALNSLNATAPATTIRDTSGGGNERGSLSMIPTYVGLDALSNAAVLDTSGDGNEREYLTDDALSRIRAMYRARIERKYERELKCPMCRGQIEGWVVVDSARYFMDGKVRDCAYENCDFSGTYSDLKKHATTVHPSEPPAMAVPVMPIDFGRIEERYIEYQNLFISLPSPDPTETPDYDNNLQLAADMLFETLNRSTHNEWPAPEGEVHQIEAPSVQSIDSSGNMVVTTRRRPRSEQDREVDYWSWGGGPDPDPTPQLN